MNRREQEETKKKDGKRAFLILCFLRCLLFVFFVDRTPFGYCSRICDCQDAPGEIWLKREFDFGRERGVKGGDAISLPPSAPRFPVSRNVFRGVKEMSIERIPMSREGYEKLKADLDRMQNIEM